MRKTSEPDFDYSKLDDLIHSRIRLAIMAVLISVDQADFNLLKQKVNATDGNLSVHLKKLEDANYLSVKKGFIGRKPQSIYKLTAIGRKAFEAYLDRLEQLIQRK
ncbi:MAG: transcriptional regulator [Candidatus Kapaibacterium sp.]|jgi:DNA-binding HxlR family transcriptional regulator